MHVKYYYSLSSKLSIDKMSSTFTRKKIQGYSYGLSDVIGKGYSSHVYKGRNDQTTHSVAIKVIDLHLLKNQINKILLESQIQVLKELKSLPHILALNEVYTTKNNTYIITQLCESDLNKTIKKGLNETEAIVFMQQIIIGYVNFAKRDIIHRDLKPANILITENQQLKIADFGFAIKAVDAAKSSKYNVGSPLYMAPESLKRNEYTLKTDIWALGVIFYEMLTGQTPWKAKNEKELVRKIENERIDDLVLKLNAGVAAKEFLRRTLRMDKTGRMDLQELSEFNFGGSGNILGEKKLNIELRSISTTHNMSMFTPKTDKAVDNRLFIDRSYENRRTSKEHSQNKFNSFRNESINHSIQLKPSFSHKYSPTLNIELSMKEQGSAGKQNPQHMVSPTHQAVRQGQNKNEKKSISKILVSEIHFCRFLFKLLSKIGDSHKKGLLQHSGSEVDGIMRDYTRIIKHKIENLVRFNGVNFINTAYYEEYKQSGDFGKLMKIAREYKERYSLELKQCWSSAISTKISFYTSATVELIEHLYKLLQLREHQDNFIDLYSKEIVILDYLITAKQLIDLFKNGQNYQRFAKKSRIEEIVQGKTADISRELYFKIMNRAKEVAVISSSDYGYEVDQKVNLLAV